MLYSFFWMIPRRLNFVCQRFGTLCSIFTVRVNKKSQLFFSVTRPMKMEQTEHSETSTHKTHTPGYHPKVRIQQVPGYLFIYLLTPWSRVLLEKLTGFAASQEIIRIL
jgi:hypothetical protein